ncbi:MAG: putative C-S lyase [Pseudomonadales bacterium]|nr:putative C-S lyase [Pseudomonadales bacterium]
MTELFNPPIERRGSDSAKWTKFASNERDVIGAWVADMDLPSADEIINAIKDRLDERVFGYTVAPAEFIPLLQEQMQRKHGWRVESDWFVVQPGVVPSLFFASNCLGNSGDGVMAARPNYHYFLETAQYTDRTYQPVDCHNTDGRWEMDFQQMSETITRRTKTFLLCNPFNPVGRVFDKEELETIANLCLKNGTMICADEIHADLVLDDDKQHLPIASLDPEIEKHSITLFSAAKAFNLPGIGGLSLAIIPDPDIRAAFQQRSYGVATHPGALAYAATIAAYRDCDYWLQETITYLQSNRDYLETEIASIEGLSMNHVEATFLAWINVAESGLDNPVREFLKHGVALSAGDEMGSSDHIRLNFGCHRTTLEEILKRMKSALS